MCVCVCVCARVVVVVVLIIGVEGMFSLLLWNSGDSLRIIFFLKEITNYVTLPDIGLLCSH